MTTQPSLANAEGRMVCPHCGQEYRKRYSAAWLLDILTNSTPHREVYLGRDGCWYVTHGAGGPVPESSVRQLVESGAIKSVYNNIPTQCYHVGRTLDCKRTIEERKRHRSFRTAPLIYVGDPSPTNPDAGAS